jgi:hypothetical protein
MNMKQQDPWAHRLLGEQNFQEQQGLLPWWYRLTSPPEAADPTLKQRDAARRSKILSVLALFLAFTLLLVASIALTDPNKQIITTVYLLYPTIAICLILNRRGHVNLASLLLITSLVGGMYLTLVTIAFHGGISPNDKDILYLPFFGELVAAALLPVSAIFLVAAINISFSLWVLLFAPHTPAFTLLLATSSSSILFRVIEIHFFVALVLWIMASWTQIAIKRADRASEIARLEHLVNTAAQQKIKEQETFDRSLAEISEVHTQIANGNLSARVPLGGDEVLWQIAVPLNNLLSRYQQARQEATEGEWYHQFLNRLVQQHPDLHAEVMRALREQRPLLAGDAPLVSAQKS